MSVTFPRGFRAASTTAGLKPSGKPDLALIVCDAQAADVASAAMVFTRNAVTGAPVIIGRERRAALLSRCAQAQPAGLRAVLINAGNSNAATGQQGVRDALACCQAVAAALGCEIGAVVPSSTGVIGRPLQVAKIVNAVPALVSALAAGPEADSGAASAIMTTDLVAKTVQRSATIGGHEVRFGAIAKGSGMIAPRLDSAFGPPSASGTMLAFITTDARICTTDLQHALELASAGSFDRISVDNHPSCSDTVIAMASGQAGGGAGGSAGDSAIRRGTREYDSLCAELRAVCEDLARQIIVDGEGATRTFRINIAGAASNAAAAAMCQQVVNSPLVKCAIHGRDPNWGRIVTAAGNAGVNFDIGHTSLTIGPVVVFQHGSPLPEALTDLRLREALAASHVELRLTVGSGSGHYWMTGCDLSKQYVAINAEYTT